MLDIKLANETYKLTLGYGASEAKSPSHLVSARGDTAAFQVIVNSDGPYSVNVGCSDWYSDSSYSDSIKSNERLRVLAYAPFDTELSIEEFITDDDGIKKADILLNSDVRDSKANVPTAIWVEVKIPKDAPAGEHEVKVRLFSSSYAKDESLVSELSLPLTVYPVDMPDYRDRKFYLDLWQHNSNIARHYDVKLWSDEHFEVIENVVKSLAKLGQKSITICASQIPWSGQGCYTDAQFGGNMFEYSIIGITKKTDGSFVYDYSKMQRYIDICTAAGISGDIEVFGLVNLWDRKELGSTDIDYVEPLRLRYYDEADGMLKYVKDRATVEDYIVSLERYFIDTDQISRVRIAADEPADIEKYRNSLNTIRSLAPSFRYKTAINHAEFIEEFGEAIDDFVPYLYCVCEKMDVLKGYQKKLENKRFLWYVCCGGGRPNTQLRQDLTESRMIGSMNYHLGFDGFLRWAYTIWPTDPRNELRYSKFECGDTALVYPAYNGNVLLSLRYKNLDRGIADYELLRLLSEDGNAELASSLTASLLDTTDMTEYHEKSIATLVGAHSHDWEDFNTVKEKVLKALSK